MPCTNDGWPEDRRPRTYNGLTAEQLEAALCAVLSTLERADVDIRPSEGNITSQVLDQVDWKEAGLRRKDVVGWWRNHVAADEARREREEQKRIEQARQKALKASALKKLTPAERASLGI